MCFVRAGSHFVQQFNCQLSGRGLAWARQKEPELEPDGASGKPFAVSRGPREYGSTPLRARTLGKQ
jgi:hypothetical protein